MPVRICNPFDVLSQSGAVWIEDGRPGGDGIVQLLANPVDVIVAASPGDVPGALGRLDAALDSGLYAAGYLGWDAGFAMDRIAPSRHGSNLPLIWLGLYEQMETLAAADVDRGAAPPAENLGPRRLNISDEEYLRCVRRILAYIAAGDVYQVNFTCKYRFKNPDSAVALFRRLRRSQPVPYPAFINLGEYQIISQSPELFLRRWGNRIEARPMKGTLRRGRWAAEDQDRALQLAGDPKNRAENVMIVDLMRNDLGRICRTGTIRVPSLVHVERYATLFQMTGQVEGELREGVRESDLIRAAFPPGSVSGAPKLRAMEIIDELEAESRGPYCGSVALFRPGGDCRMNVAIRTIVQRGQDCEMGVGSGIVIDSVPQDELAETRLKSHFLDALPPDFELLETLRLRPDGTYDYLNEHITRLLNSADYFGRPLAEGAVREALAQMPAEGREWRIRLLVDWRGAIRMERHPLAAPSPGPGRAVLARRVIDPGDVFLYHKTTRREAYNREWAEAVREGYVDLVYQNTKGDITEGAVSNILAQINGQWWTPPLDSGLLPGCLRQRELADGRIRERRLSLKDLKDAYQIAFINSVRGRTLLDQIDDPASGVPFWRRATGGANG